MCSMYWNLDTKITCPACRETTVWNLQTHFMGDFGSYSHSYKLDEVVSELEGVTIVLNGKVDDFNGDCEKCGRMFDVGAEITSGKVTRVWVLREWVSHTKLT